MSYIEDTARDALKAAHLDLTKARRTLVLAAGLLALIHLLNVYPYLRLSSAIAGAERSMEANSALVAQLDPEIERLRTAGERASARLDTLLKGVTDEMIRDFAELRGLVERAMQGQLPEAVPPSIASFAPPSAQQMQAPQMQQQVQLPQMQQQMQQMPLGGQMEGRGTNLNMLANMSEPSTIAPELRSILEGVAAGEPDAYERLTAYARRTIVEAAYSRAQDAWSAHIRPAYLAALDAAEKGARRAAENAPASVSETASALRSVADELMAKRATVEAIRISHDNTVDSALGTDWWRTVEGKGAFADAVAESIAGQMREIANTAAAPSAAIQKTLELQQRLRDSLIAQQHLLEQQFTEQRKQLATLSGATGAVPIDLASFIGLFPLVLGLVLGLMMLRCGEARRQAALAAADLFQAAPEDRDTRVWLARRVLGADDTLRPLMVTIALLLGATLWIVLAAMQVTASPTSPPLPPWTSGVLGVLFVLAATFWDGAAIRRLGSELHR